MPRKIDLSYESSTVTIPVTAIVTLLCALVLALCGWLWLLHQRTDAIPVIQVEVLHIKSSVERLEHWAGTTPKQAQTQTQPSDSVATH